MDRHGVRPDPEAVEAVLTWKAPRTDTQLMSFLGFANYYREFIKGYADKVYPMQKLMRNKGKKFEWNDEAQVAFENKSGNCAKRQCWACLQKRACMFSTQTHRWWPSQESCIKSKNGTEEQFSVPLHTAAKS